MEAKKKFLIDVYRVSPMKLRVSVCAEEAVHDTLRQRPDFRVDERGSFGVVVYGVDPRWGGSALEQEIINVINSVCPEEEGQPVCPEDVTQEETPAILVEFN